MDRLDIFEGYDVEIVMVCDGSPDASYTEMCRMQEEYPNTIRVVKLARNFGQGAAISCGAKIAKGDVVGVISCDLQDPFELFIDMLKAWREESYKLVIASREHRSDALIGKIASSTFNRMVHTFIDSRYPVGGFDFFLMDRQVVDAFTAIDAANGSMQMLLVWLGYQYKEIPYTRSARSIGKSSYKLSRKMEIASGLFTTYSPILSRVWYVVGACSIVASIIVPIVLMNTIADVRASELIIIGLLLFITGVVLISNASVGEYSWRTLYQSLGRPRYVIDEIR